MYTGIYVSSLPPVILAMADTPAMQRLSRVGMHCGCEYTAYPIYRDALAPYSRYTHSLGTAAIVWHFTHDLKQFGFPLGAMDTKSKAFEAKTAIENGCQ